MSSRSENDMFRRLTFGETYTRALQIGYQHGTFFLSVGIMIFVPYVVFMIHYMHMLGELVTAAAEDAQDNDENNDQENEAFLEALTAMHGEIARIVAELVLYSFVGILGGCTMARAVAQIYVGGASTTSRRPSLRECGKQAFARFCNIFAASWIVGLGVIVAYVVTIGIAMALLAVKNVFGVLMAIALIVAFAVAFVYIQVAMMLATPVVMVENKGPIQTIQRCWELANNNRCYIYCTLFCLMFVLMVVMGIVGGVVFANDPMARFSTGGAIFQTLPYIIVLPLATIVSTVVYLNIRIEHEGLNQQVLCRDLRRGAGNDNDDYVALAMAEQGEDNHHDHPYVNDLMMNDNDDGDKNDDHNNEEHVNQA